MMKLKNRKEKLSAEYYQIRSNEDMQMIRGLASEYHALYYFNISEGTFKAYSIDEKRFPEAKAFLDSSSNPIEVFHKFGDSPLVHPEDRHIFRNLSVPAICEKLAHSKKATYRFRRKFGDEYLWSEMEFIKYEDIDEKPNVIALGFAERDSDIRSSEALTRCFAILGKEISPEESINELMALAGEYYDANRAYIFEFSEGGATINNTFEWCKDGVEAMISNLQDIPSQEVDGWMKEFERHGAFHMDTLDTENAYSTPEGRALLEMQGIQSLIAAPLMGGDITLGFIGVDDPKKAKGNIEVLKNIAAVAYSEILKRRQAKMALFETAKIFSDAFLGAYLSAYYVNLNDCSQVFLHRYKYIEDNYGHIESYLESVTKYINENVHPDDRAVMLEAVQPAYIKERLKTETMFSVYMRDISGEEMRWYRFDVTRGADPDHAGLAFSDVTEKLEEEREKREELRENMELISGLAKEYTALFYINMDEGTFKSYSIETPHLADRNKFVNLNVSGPEMLQRYGHSEYVHPDDRHNFDGLDNDLIRERLAHSKIFSIRFRRLIEGGEYHWFELDFIKYGDLDERANAVALGFADRDEEIRREQQIAVERDLANQQRHLKAFGDMINAAPWSLGINDRNEIDSVYWSDEIRHMLGYRSQEEIPNTIDIWASLLHPEDRERVLTHVRDCIASLFEGLIYDISYRLRHKSGEYRWYHAAGRLEGTEDGKRRLYGVITDITADKELEEQHALSIRMQSQLKDAYEAAEVANKSKSNFLFNMSHDIRTPMNAITGFTAMAKKNLDDKEKVLDYLNKIDLSGQQLLMLINQVLEMSRIESGKIEFDDKPLNVKENYDSLVTVLEEQAKVAGLEFHHSLCDVKHYHIIADDARLSQITLNITGNAIKYTPKGGRIDYLFKENPCSRKGYASYTFTVSDTGIGMSPEFLKVLFEPFSREKSSTVSKIQGTGLGMSIVKSLVDLLGGTIEVESEPGKGTRFDVTLEFKIDREEELAAASDSDFNDASFEGRRILLVEDNELNREIARFILEERGIVTEEAEDGDIAVKKVRDMVESGDLSRYDAILMDVQMPKLNGYEATSRIRKILEGTGVHIPIIAMTANAFEEDRQNALAAGMDDHLAKPIDTDRLWSSLARYLK